MNAVAANFQRRVLMALTAAGGASIGALMLALRPFLLLESEALPAVIRRAALVLSLSLALSLITSLIVVRRHRYSLRTLAVGSSAIEPEELAGLSRIPSRLANSFVALMIGGAATMVAPLVRPPGLDVGRAVSLAVLAATVVGAMAIPLFVFLRAQAGKLIEIAPLEPVLALLGTPGFGAAAQERTARRLVVAIAVPVLLVGVGTVLITHAHLRSFLEASRTTTANAYAHASLEAAESPLSSGIARPDAVEAAAEFGFETKLLAQELEEPSTVRDPDGLLRSIIPLSDGHADVRYAAELDPLSLTGVLGVALVAFIAALYVGRRLGNAFSQDFTHAIARIGALGTERVLSDGGSVSQARFDVIRRHEQAIEGLADRFREFAAAQEQALDAKERALRMRGLLFASVSHDLKSPLNAILGFADLLDHDDLSEGQRESLSMIESRGRELLALIETILDAARVEAGQLQLDQRLTSVEELVLESLRQARELSGESGDVVFEASRDLVPIPVDPSHVGRAVAVIIAHAMRSSTAEGKGAAVRVTATNPESGASVRITIEYHSRHVHPSELVALFAQQGSHRGRGLTLGLSLARSIFELSGGHVEVESLDGAPIVHAFLPIMPLPPDSLRRRLSSHPALTPRLPPIEIKPPASVR